MCHLAQRRRALTAPAQPEGFQPGTLVGNDGTERPAAAQRFNQPDQIVVVDGKHARVTVRQRRSARFGVTDNRLHLDIAQMPPFNRFIRPCAGGYAQRRENQRGLSLCARHEEIFQRSERRYSFTHSHARPDVAARDVDFVVDDEVLIRAGCKYCGWHSYPSNRCVIASRSINCA